MPRLPTAWSRAGPPADAIYVELGPGRGTLAADALRVLRAADFAGAVHLVETSPVLRERQKAAVPDAQWHESIDDLPDRPLLLVANEFLDALPIQQFADGIERRINVQGGGLAFDRDGEIVELSPAREAVVERSPAASQGPAASPCSSTTATRAAAAAIRCRRSAAMVSRRCSPIPASRT